MAPRSGPRRLLLVLALLPQLFVLGLGRGMVVCIAPDGHVEVEIARNRCCAVPAPGSAVRGGELVRAGHDSGCGSCADLELALDPRATRGPDWRSIELGAGQSTAHLEATIPPPAPDPAGFLERCLARGHVPLRASLSRSRVLRC